MDGYSFSAPAIKEREVRLDGLFLPPPDQVLHKPAIILEAQIKADPEFLLRLYSESALVLRHHHRQGQPLRHWRVLVICPSRDLDFGDPLPVQEFVRERLLWIELAPDRMPPAAPPLQRALGLLLLPVEHLPASTEAIRSQAAGTPLAADINDVIAAILLSRFRNCTISEVCAMSGITIDDFTQSVAFREIYGLGSLQGRQEGRQEGLQEGRQKGILEGRQAEAAAMALRLLQRRCGSMTPEWQSLVKALPLADLEALAEALLEFQGPEDLTAWLADRQK